MMGSFIDVFATPGHVPEGADRTAATDRKRDARLTNPLCSDRIAAQVFPNPEAGSELVLMRFPSELKLALILRDYV
jgi:hypothetical protein